MNTLNRNRNIFINDEGTGNHDSNLERPTMVQKPVAMASVFEFYLTQDIGILSKYDDWYIACEEATENDLINVHINSFGGCLETALQIHNALMMTRATVFVHIEGACCSGASIIAMAGDQHIIAPNAYMMIHSWTGGTYGKFGNVIENSEFQTKWFKAVMFRCYKDFLSEKEIESVLDGKDVWLDSKEVESRYEKNGKEHDKENEKKNAKNTSVKEKIAKLLTSKRLAVADIT